MSDYRAKAGSEIALISLTVLDPQPHSVGVQATSREFALNGALFEQGPYIQLMWDHLESSAEVIAIYTVFDLHDALSAPVTIYVPRWDYTYKRYNGTAIRPQPSWNNYFARNVVITVRDLVEL